MGKPKRKKKPKHQPGPSMQTDPAARLAELDGLVAALVEAGGGDGPAWGQIHKLLIKTDADSAVVAGIIARRDVPALKTCVDQLLGRETAIEEAQPVSTIEIDDETMKKAMRAFRKRLKLTKLDHESKLGVGPMTGGKKAEIDAIIAPREFGDDVWQALVAAGRLKPMGPGFYGLADGEK